MDNPNHETSFGDYVPKELLNETTSTRSWLAEQESVGRMVLIEELKDEAIDSRGEFLADVRAKAAVDHPLVGSIYEASTENGHCFFAHELLPGETLARMVKSGTKLKALRFVHLLRRVAEANIYHEARDNATSPLGPENIYMDTQGVIRMQNLAIAGSRLPDHSTRDVTRTGAFFEDLLDRDFPGATRCQTLLAWMRGQEVEKPLRWQQVRDYCEQIEQQLTEPVGVTAPATAAMRPDKKSGFVWVVVILLVGVFVGVMLLPRKERPPSANAEKPGWVTVEGDRYEVPGGPRVRVQGFDISAHEVTIGDYADFLETLSILSEDGREKTFDHSEQPADKQGHIPDDWTNLLASAIQAGSWNGKEVNIHTPVTGVDWWDAYAYAKWKRGFLPSQDQWFGALMSGTQAPADLPVSDLLAVTEKSPDRTANGILGLAGSVSEWTSEPGTSPSNPLGVPQWIIIGGSYLNPAKGALTRKWVDKRSTRKPDLGFRICRKTK